MAATIAFRIFSTWKLVCSPSVRLGRLKGSFSAPAAWPGMPELYVADAINNRILVFKDDGTYLRDLTAGQNYHLAYHYDVELAGNND